ncbi:MAG: DUF29 family protein [Prochloron sp. SP5CPC1]|nr:DUF29 family protein [Candidatus Paraprochloron terpiosi SP5CPC1]
MNLKPPTNLYEQDYYLWLTKTAEILKSKDLSALDLPKPQKRRSMNVVGWKVGKFMWHRVLIPLLTPLISDY